METTSETPQSDFQERPIRTKGKWVVFFMFGFGIIGTGSLWVYWKMHVGPFVPLQKLLVEKFPDSKPRVEGGQKKMRESFPKILRVTMKVDFDPNTETEKRELFVREVERLIFEKFDDITEDFQLSDFEKFELHLFLPQPEKKVITWDRESTNEEFMERFQPDS